MISRVFIERPKLAFVISIVMSLAGLLCIKQLPIAEYPEIAPPTIMVSATYPGATSQVITETVASVIEEQVNGVEDLIYFKSDSDNNGNYTLTCTFKSGINSDIALVNVQNAVQRAESQLPDDVRALGITVTKRSTDMIAVYSFITDGKKLNNLELANYVRINIKAPFARLPGVSFAEILGERNYSMRVWLDPLKLASLNITPSQVAAKIGAQNIQAAAGSVGAEESSRYMQLKIDALGRLKTPEQFAEIVLYSSEDGQQITLGDVARIELGAEYYSSNGHYNDKESVAIALYRQDGANAIDVVNGANALLAELKERFPDGIEGFLAYDPTDYIRTSIEEIATTLIITLLLVVGITFVFLQNWRATLVPALAIPVSLLGTFFFMAILGYSINVLTMFGLILVIGSLVDDAIVVVENTMRIVETEGLSAKEAAIKSMQQITGPVIATTLVTVAIYAPVGFYGGLVGTIYKQFSVTMCIALCLSTVNALTLSPALCALLLNHRPNQKKNFFFRKFDALLDGTKAGYLFASRLLIRRLWVTILLLAVAVGCNFLIFRSLKGGLLPDEDKGALLCDVELPPGSSIYRTGQVMKELNTRFQAIPGIDHTITVAGFSIISGQSENVGFAIVVLDDWAKRKSAETNIRTILAKVMETGNALPQAKVRAFQPPAIMGLGVTGGVTFALQTTGNDSPKEFEGKLYSLLGALNNKKVMPDIQYAFSTFNASTPQLFLDIDRRKAEALGVSISDIFLALQSQLASLYINDFNLYGYSFKVKIQVDSDSRSNLNHLEEINVRNATGQMVPLSAIATVRRILGARNLERFNQSLSANVTAIGFPAASTGNIMKKIETYVKENLPKDYTISWTDMSYQERGNEGKIVFLMLLAVIFGYLFLVAQYESWSIPMPIVVSVLFATLGGLLALHWSDMALDIYAQLGLIMLIGLACKSAILMVEFSMQERSAGRSIAKAALNGANFRYRAVLMTAWSFIIGVFPLVFATGAGSAGRRIIGVSTCFGMLCATLVGIAFIPPLYLMFQKTREKIKTPHNR